MSGSTITVAVVSPLCRIGDVEANLLEFDAWVARATAQGAQLALFPELALSGYAHDPEVTRTTAEPIPGPATSALERIARARGVTLSVGMLERCDGVYYTAQIVVGPQGYLGHYRKHCPTANEQQTMLVSSGQGYPVFAVGGIRLGINICADSRQPGTIDALAEQGVDLVHTPHANGLGLGANAEEWTRGKLVYYLDRVVRCRAHIAVNNIAGSATYGTSVRMDYSGGAMILDPLGQVVKRTTEQDRTPHMIVATLDTDLRHYIPDFELRHIANGTSHPVPRRVLDALAQIEVDRSST
jgi:N-carbamoylputrescine amidase